MRRKTTKETNKLKAIAFAKEFFNAVTFLRSADQDAARINSSFAGCARELLKTEKAKLDRKALSQVTYDIAKYRLRKTVVPYFGNRQVKDIDYYALDGFLTELSGQQIASSTIRAYMGLVYKVLAYAARRKFIPSLPEFPRIKVVDVARGWFTPTEYLKLWHGARQLLGMKIEVRKYTDSDGKTQTQYLNSEATGVRRGKLMRHVEMTEDFVRLLVFMVNSYIRPTDIKFMQHKHVDVVEGEHRYLRLRLPPTKGHSDPITTMPKSVETYQKLREFHAQQRVAGDELTGDDYVFSPQYKLRDYALKQFQRQFEVLMWHTGLSAGAEGEERTLYSLRHTAIMYRLLYGASINTLALARNARTSTAMIDRFYAKPLTGEMNIGMLQSRRKRSVNGRQLAGSLSDKAA